MSRPNGNETQSPLPSPFVSEGMFMLTPAEREELIGALNVLSRYTQRATGKPLPFQVLDYGKVCIGFENISISIGGLAAEIPSSPAVHDHWEALALLELEMSSVV
jgi:hypothetical protein